VRQSDKATLLTIFIDEKACSDDRLLFESIMLKAREADIADATVFRGMLQFGQFAGCHTTEMLRHLSYDLPTVIEIVEPDEKIQHFLSLLTPLKQWVVTLAEVQVLPLRDDTTATRANRESTGTPSRTVGE
jgi:PII-like signaling protein